MIIDHHRTRELGAYRGRDHACGYKLANNELVRGELLIIAVNPHYFVIRHTQVVTIR